MATTKKKAPAKKAAAKKATPKAPEGNLVYPKNVAVLGTLSFPLWSEEDLDKLKVWRSEKGHSPGQYPDRVGGSLFLDQKAVDHVQEYLLETFMPFTAEQYAHTGGKKGFNEEAIAELTALIEQEDWSEANLPIKELTDKDIENLGEDTDIVAKLAFAGSGGSDITKKALRRDDDGALEVASLDMLSDDGVAIGDTERLWWGSRNPFRGAFNMNAYTRDIKKGVVVYGISAYTRTLYLRSDLELDFGSGNDDAEVLEDDYED